MRNIDRGYIEKAPKTKKSSQNKLILLLTAVLLGLIVALVVTIFNSDKSLGQSSTVNNSTLTINETNNEEILDVTPSPDNQGLTAEETTTTPEIEPSTILINETVKGRFTTLNINLEVATHEGEQYGIYDASPMSFNVDECLAYVFPECSKDELFHPYSNENLQEKYNLGNMDYRNEILYFINKDADKSIMYDPNNYAVQFSYIPDGKLVKGEAPGQLFRRKQDYIYPDETLLKEAKNMSYELLSTIFKDEFTENFTHIYSGRKTTETDMYNEEAVTEVYLTVYQRVIDGLPILYDKQRALSNYWMEPVIDELEVWVDDSKLIYAFGAIRHFELREESNTISPHEALEVLKQNVDSIDKKGSYNIKRFELMYYAAFTDDADSTDVYAKIRGAGYAKYIPVWVIASGERIDEESNEYVMIIDAITGEIVERRHRD